LGDKVKMGLTLLTARKNEKPREELEVITSS
jgi:hypothetical protein